MADIVDRQTRSRMMSGIRGKNTKPEMILRRALHARGFRYRLHGKGVPGRPDLILAKHRAVIFVHGCFWHRHEGCRYATTPATRPEYWAEKFAANVRRDRAACDGGILARAASPDRDLDGALRALFGRRGRRLRMRLCRREAGGDEYEREAAAAGHRHPSG